MTKAPTSRATGGLPVASLEIGRVLADRDGVTFRAQGTCMYPTIRPGDVLRIRSCKARDVAVGEIAVCRTPGFLFSHRVISKGEREGRAFVVTRSDRNPGAGDGPTFDENMLGVVIAATRNGQPVPLQPARDGLPVRSYHAARLAFIGYVPRLRAFRADVIASAGGRIVQQSLARAWFRLSRPKVKFVVRVPLNVTLGERVYWAVDPVDFDPAQQCHGRVVERWTLAAHLGGALEPAAWATFVRDSGNFWGVVDSNVRQRYRGVGLEEALLERAKGLMARAG
jgi:signal peptidase I